MSEVKKIHPNIITERSNPHTDSDSRYSWRIVRIQITNEWGDSWKDNLHGSGIKIFQESGFSKGKWQWRSPVIEIFFKGSTIPANLTNRLEVAQLIIEDIDDFWKDPQKWVKDFIEFVPVVASHLLV